MWPAALITLILLIGLGLVLVRQWAGLWTKFRHRGGRADMETAWQSWQTYSGKSASQESISRSSHDLDDEVRESVHKSLLEFEASLRPDPNPMLTVRRELMDSVDRRQLNSEILKLPEGTRVNLRNSNPEILQSDEAARVYIIANELRIAVLREYTSLRYGDRADGDWFDVYQKASRLRQRSTRNYIERALGGTQTTTDDARFHTMKLMDGEIRTRLLQVPAGTRFPGFGKAVEQTSKPA